MRRGCTEHLHCMLHLSPGLPWQQRERDIQRVEDSAGTAKRGCPRGCHPPENRLQLGQRLSKAKLWRAGQEAGIGRYAVICRSWLTLAILWRKRRWASATNPVPSKK